MEQEENIRKSAKHRSATRAKEDNRSNNNSKPFFTRRDTQVSTTINEDEGCDFDSPEKKSPSSPRRSRDFRASPTLEYLTTATESSRSQRPLSMWGVRPSFRVANRGDTPLDVLTTTTNTTATTTTTTATASSSLPSLPTTPPVGSEHQQPKKRHDYDRELQLPPIPILPPELCHEIFQFRMGDYAQQFFRQQKTQYNKKCRLPIEKVAEYSKALPKSSLLLSNLSFSSDSIEMFKWLTYYMGEKKPTSFLKDATEIEIARIIIKKAVDTPPLRDELFCQLVKQTNNNPSEQGTEKGWELMCMVFEAVQPSADFEDFLIKYFQDTLSFPSSPPRVRLYSIYCMRRLGQLMDKPLVPHVPYTPTLESVKEAPFIKSVFRSSLAEIMEMQALVRPELKIPLILKTLADAIVIAKGLETVGIFRVTAQKSELAELRKELESTCGLFNNPPTDPHLPACLLKEWLGEIRNPIVPTEFYEIIMDNSGDWVELQRILERFPKINKDCLFFITNFFQRVAKTESNMMKLSNIATVISPTLCRAPFDDAKRAMQMSKHETQFVCTLLENLPQQKVL